MDELGIYFGHVLVNEQLNEVVNDTMIEDFPIVEDDTIVNVNGIVEVDEDVTYQQLSEDSSSNSEYNPIGEDTNLSDVDDINDFDEAMNVIGVVHSDSGIDEIYKEKGLNGRKQFEFDNDGKICLCFYLKSILKYYIVSKL